MKKLNLALILILGFVFACKKDDNGNGSNGNTNGTSSEIIKDIDGNVYTSIVIVDTEWMVENLKTTRYCNGDEIRNLTSDTEWSDPEATGSAGAWSYYNNDSSYNEPYGKLYNWFAVNDQRGVCPCGWRVPSITEWIQLIRVCP